MKTIKSIYNNSKIVDTSIALENGYNLYFTKGQILDAIKPTISMEEFEEKFVEYDIDAVIGDTELFNDWSCFYGTYDSSYGNKTIHITDRENADHVLLSRDVSRDETILSCIGTLIGDNDMSVVNICYNENTVYALMKL